jgi:hypothetical protein
MQTAPSVRLVDSAGASALSRQAIAAALAAGRPVFVTSARSGSSAALPRLAPSTPDELAALVAYAPGLKSVDPRTLASFTAAPGTAPRDDGEDALAYHFQALLGAWNGAYPGHCRPLDYGSSDLEYTGTRNPRTTSATRSFQVWHNAIPSATASDQLRTDGAPDVATYGALLRLGAFLAAHAVAPKRASTATETATGGALSGISTGVGLALAAAAAYVFRAEIGL